MKCDQRAVRITCLGSSMVGIIDLPERPLPRGVLVAAGHPYSRLGARRQFAMLARSLARRGIAVMRFDRRGVGDSEGCDNNDSDVRAALQEFCDQVPALQEVVLLAPGGSAAIATARACAAADARVRGLLLLTPWRRGNARHAPQLDAVIADKTGSGLSRRGTPAGKPAGAPALTLVSSADAAALYWRRTPAPVRAGVRGREASLALLAEQLCGFPGPVLVVAGDAVPSRLLDGGDPGEPDNQEKRVDVDQLKRRAELARLTSLVMRAGAGDRVRIIALPAAAATDADARAAGEVDRNGLTGACADWLVSW